MYIKSYIYKKNKKSYQKLITNTQDLESATELKSGITMINAKNYVSQLKRKCSENKQPSTCLQCEYFASVFARSFYGGNKYPYELLKSEVNFSALWKPTKFQQRPNESTTTSN